MRKNRNGASLVDIYRILYRHYGPQGWWPAKTRFEVIVGAILTQNTAWTNVEKAIRNLKKASLLSSPHKIRRITRRRLAGLIRPAGYFNVKSKRLKNFIDFLYKRYNCDLSLIPRRELKSIRQELLDVNGIGPETCDSILLYAFDKPVFVVDAYTKRIFSRHGYIKEDADYHKVQEVFMGALPRDTALYNEYHALIVRLAKDFCRKRPDCSLCPLRGISNQVRNARF